MIRAEDFFKIETEAFYNIEKVAKYNFESAEIDSRRIKENQIFFAIKGENTDGHKYLKDVFKKGVKLAVVEKKWFLKNKKDFVNSSFIVVADTILSLGAFAQKHREKFGIPVLCIGGSNGKTTTKDLVASVLSQKYNVLKTEGNFNNHIGLPLTLLRLNDKHNFAVLEVGCNHFGEIKYLCEIAKPQYGMITNIGREHLEFFKTTKGVAKAEFELYDYLKKNNAVCFCNVDDDFINKYSDKLKKENKFTYSNKKSADVKGKFVKFNKDFEPELNITYKKSSFNVTVATFGKHSVVNGLAAASAGLYFDVSPMKIRKSLKEFKPTSSKRMEVIIKNGLTIINDAYNSNPDSVKMGLETINEFKTKGNKYAVLSDMLELGKASKNEHSYIGSLAVKLKLENLFTTGPESLNTYKSAKGVKNNLYFEKKTDLISHLKNNIKKNDVIYVKGSRGMKMEEVVENLIQNSNAL
ncbi:MAG: UDP-N-acetylmuramoyl-tripeptide--D-alanyl-D-alanine ligase [Bacteroidetes bacterium]|nr:UDP-N-acetylmuramoyl-tripeptide--D-alanyl-D-alanine ligase [Bacteroidota bacterium]